MLRQLDGMRCAVMACCVVALAMVAPAALAETVHGAPLEAGWHLDGSNTNFAVTPPAPPPGPRVEIGLKANALNGADLPQDAGTYYAQAGTAWHGDGGYDVASWNFSVSVAFPHEIDGGTSYFPTVWQDGIALLSDQPSHGAPGAHSHFGNQTVRLAIDFDPSGGGAGQGILNLSALLADDPDIDVNDVYGYQISENMMFLWLQNPDIWEVVPPIDPADFDPWAFGDYAFALTVSTHAYPDYASVGMTVSVVPEPGTLALLALGGIGLLSNRKRVRR